MSKETTKEKSEENKSRIQKLLDRLFTKDVDNSVDLDTITKNASDEVTVLNDILGVFQEVEKLEELEREQRLERRRKHLLRLKQGGQELSKKNELEKEEQDSQLESNPVKTEKVNEEEKLTIPEIQIEEVVDKLFIKKAVDKLEKDPAASKNTINIEKMMGTSNYEPNLVDLPFSKSEILVSKSSGSKTTSKKQDLSMSKEALSDMIKQSIEKNKDLIIPKKTTNKNNLNKSVGMQLTRSQSN